MFEYGMAVWATRFLCIVIALHSSNRHVFAHYLLRLFITCGIFWCYRQKGNNSGLIEAVKGEHLWRRLNTRGWHIQAYNTYNYMHFVYYGPVI